VKISRRSFVASGLAGFAGAFGRAPTPRPATEAHAPAQRQAKPLPSEDGSKLWLRYAPPGEAADAYRRTIRQVFVEGRSATAQATLDELRTGFTSVLDTATPAVRERLQDGAVVVGTPETSPAIRGLNLDTDLGAVGREGFLIRSTTIANHPVIVIASQGELGALYGAFHFLRLLQTGTSVERLAISEKPKVQLRLLNHWDNLNGSIERGYGGRSLWQWDQLPKQLSPRYLAYARANASIGVNGAVINNVNADINILNANYLPKVAALATVWRPYGVRMYLSVNFAAPVRLGKLATADPLNQQVIDWWRTKADEIYNLIPDFGGFLVKANSEGQPGPRNYNRTHAEGANVLANALAPHQGNVIWRAFVYDEGIDPDRVKRAYIEFTRLDGQFRPNVLIQIKNGPLDFMPREPHHPLFGALQHTPGLAELQATQEYLGQAKHLVYLGTMWKEFLQTDTFAKGAGSTVAKCIDGTVHPMSVTGMVAVTNPGTDANWCGHDFSQSNWYAFGRLAWNHELTAEQIAEEWVRMTFTNDRQAVTTIKDMMMTSRETYLNYTMPVGLHHLIGGDHYAPMPQNDRAQRSDWTATYYHRAAADGIGFNRTRTGSNAVAQYFPPVRDMFESLQTCPDKFLLWFHHLAWNYQMRSGKTLWQELVDHYYQGTRHAAGYQTTWASLSDKVHPGRHRAVADRLATQVRDSARWRDHILQYFAGFNRLPIQPTAQG